MGINIGALLFFFLADNLELGAFQALAVAINLLELQATPVGLDLRGLFRGLVLRTIRVVLVDQTGVRCDIGSLLELFLELGGDGNDDLVTSIK